ncbi:unnamed protein product [Pleuronectes platessa]|uniref:Uncharacterized protein n=1 Tax=Pleuronectes platessa TaxID=8262 RepID=A0A9N7Z2F7_PLEPL|nr:unnamed protein product [Pleuronectes platessa]
MSPAEGVSFGSLRADVGLLQTELYLCARELGAAGERVHTQTRVLEEQELQDLNVERQAHGSSGAFWEADMESLVMVIEMKNKILNDQRKDLQMMEELVEKNRSLEQTILHLNHNNENQRVQMDNCWTLPQYVLLQAHGSSGPFLEADIKSLVIIIDMKNKILNYQRKALQIMEELVEKNRAQEREILY